MDKDHAFTLFEGTKLLAEFLYMLHFYGAAINNLQIVELFKFYQKLCLVFCYGLLPDKSVFVCGGFNFCAVNENGLA